MKSEEEYLSNLKKHFHNDELGIQIREIETHLLKNASRHSSINKNKIIVLSILLLLGGGGFLFQMLNIQKPKVKTQSSDVVIPQELNKQSLAMKSTASQKSKSKKSKQLLNTTQVVILDNSLIQATTDLMIDVSDYNNIASPTIDISDYENIITF